MYTPDNITELKDNEVFVFGSNGQGNHAGGAAKVAHEKFGAIIGKPEGLQGQSYAINTMDGLDVFSKQVNTFYDFVKDHQELVFYLTKVGCGISGYAEHEVKQMFTENIDNLIKPRGW